MEEQSRIIAESQWREYKRLREQIEEANEVIKFFAESKVGEKQEDGTYVVFTCGEKENEHVLGYKRYTYNPKPAVDYIKKWGVK